MADLESLLPSDEPLLQQQPDAPLPVEQAPTIEVTAPRLSPDELNADDMDSAYTQHRSSGSTKAMEDELLRELGLDQNGDPITPQTPEQQATELPAEPPADGGVTPMGVVKDVGEGLVETPRAITFGALNAVNEAVDLLDSAAQYMAETFGDIRFGPNGLEVLSAEEVKQRAASGEEADIPSLPNVDRPDSVTGNIISNVTQFLVGFKGAGKALKAWKAASKTQQAGKAAAKGAIADFTVFDPYEGNLSNLIQSSPELANPINALLAADPNDGEAINRARNTLEGLGLGVVAEGVIRGVQGIRAGRIAKREAIADGKWSSEPVPELDEVQLDRLLGDTKKSNLILFNKVLKAQGENVDPATVKGGKKPTEGFDEELRINFAKIQSGEDVKKLIAKMGELDAEGVDAARRGVRTWQQTKLSADQENAWGLVSNRAKGQAYNAEELKAVKELWVTTANKLKDVTDEAFNNPNQASMAAFMHMQEVYRLVNREFMGAQAEAGRALNILRQPTGPNDDMARIMSQTIDDAGGQRTVMEMVTKLKKLTDAGLYDKADDFVMKSWTAKTRNAVAQVWINALLSNPVSHVANNLSGWATMATRLGERKVAEYVNQVFGDNAGVVSGETFAMMQGVTQSFREALSASAKSLKTGESQLVKSETGRRQGGFSAQTWNVSSDTPLGKALDFVDVATQTPGRLMQAGDEFFKAIGYRMELHAQATRMAASEVASGKITQEQAKTRIAEIIANPPDNVRLEAVGEALYHTFTNKPAELPSAIANAWQRIPALGLMTLPFKNTPINIMTYGFERTPLAPLVKSWREDIAAGGARADLAMAKVATGSMIMAVAMDLVMSGACTGQGPVDPQERALFEREGKQAYSCKIGDSWVSYRRIEPAGTVFGLAADLVEIVNNGDVDQMEVEQAFAAITFAAANAVTSKTYMQGIADLMQAITDAPRYGEGYVRGLVGATIPAGVAAVARLEDPYMRSAWSIVDTMKRRTPGLSDELPLRRDLWGRPISYKSGVGLWYDALSPVYIKKENPEPIDKELERLGYFPPMPDRHVSLRDPETFASGRVDLRKYPQAYSRYVELAGNEYKDEVTGLGAKDRLNALIAGEDVLSPIYDMLTDGPDGGKAAKLNEVITGYRQKAARQLVEEFPELRVEINANVKPPRFNME